MEQSRYCPVKWGGELTWLSGVSRVEWAQPGDLHRKPIEIGIVVHTKWFGHETRLNGSLTCCDFRSERVRHTTCHECGYTSRATK